MAAAFFGWSLGQWQAARQQIDIRREIAREIVHDDKLLQACMDDMRHQFTPGYRSSMPLARFDGEGDVLRMSQGEIFRTQCPTNLAIDGEGFFVLGSPDRPVFTRDGRFLWREGRLVDTGDRPVLGYPVDQPGRSRLGPIRVSLHEWSQVRFDSAGTVWGESVKRDAVTGQTTTTSTVLRRIALAWFENPTRLVRQGDTGFVPSLHSGPPNYGNAETGRLGVICPSSLELSNVDSYECQASIAALRMRAGLLTGKL